MWSVFVLVLRALLERLPYRGMKAADGGTCAWDMQGGRQHTVHEEVSDGPLMRQTSRTCSCRLYALTTRTAEKASLTAWFAAM